jgi:alcohol dehydrogenase class IV
MQAAEQFISAVKMLQSEVGIPKTLSCVEVKDIKILAKAALKEAHYFYPVPKYLTPAKCEQLITQLCTN